MKRRTEELRQKIRKAAQEEPFGSRRDCLKNSEDALLDRVLAFETPPKCILMELLSESGVDLPKPLKLNERELSAKLWKVIHALLKQSIVLGNTDHLSDRELYTLLWNVVLREEFVLYPNCTLQIDMTRIGPDHGLAVYLKYYASETQRKIYSSVHPEFKMPPHVEPPGRRDHLIPENPLDWCGNKLQN